jgi:hypothetical protein
VEKLFLATFEWNHGEYETVDFRIVHACTIEEAKEKALKHLRSMWGNETVQDEELFSPTWGYPCVSLKSIEEIDVKKLLSVSVLNIT